MYLDHQKGSSNCKIKTNALGSTSAPVDIFSLNVDEAEESMLRTAAWRVQVPYKDLAPALSDIMKKLMKMNIAGAWRQGIHEKKG